MINVSKHLDLTKPFTQADLRLAIAKAQGRQAKPTTIQAAARAGYGLELIQPTHQARVCAAMFGRQIRPIPHFVKSH